METKSSSESDRSLCERFLSGDRSGFDQLVERYHDRTFKLVRGIVGDWHLAEDVCQEVFATLYRKAGSFRHEANLGTWLYRVALNAGLKARRKQRTFLRSIAAAFTSRGGERTGEPEDPPPPELETSEVFEKLVRPLPESLRSAVVLREAGGMSYDEIAKVLGCSRGAVEQRLHRALVLLREVWKDQHESIG